MKVYNNINKKEWSKYTERPQFENKQLTKIVRNILAEVKKDQDAALKKFSLQFDKVEVDSFEVSKKEIDIACNTISQELKNAIINAKNNIEKFHASQEQKQQIVETTKGVKCWRKSIGIEKVGLYIPGGTAPLFSTILMLGIPAQLANCKEIILCTPCNSEGIINPAILFTAQLVGISKIYKIGGAQAIAAMAYGTESIPSVYKIFGPGNQYVTKAKELVQQEGIAIDMPAGPSEVLVIADDSSDPEFIASDLLSQAEHGVDSQVVLLSNSKNIIDNTLIAINQQLEVLPRKEIAKIALQNSTCIYFEDIENCYEFSNYYAPEHLIIASQKPHQYIHKITNAGSVFLGNYTCESAGDYASGTNHTLPTNGFAKNYSGVSLDSFVKKITFQEISKEGIQNLGNTIEIMAEAEQLIAHKNAVSIRLKSIKNV